MIIGRKDIGIDKIFSLAKEGSDIALDQGLRKSVEKCRKFLEGEIRKSSAPIYGVNTGFGALCDTKIPADAISELQENLVISHACGMGEEVPEEICRLMLLLKIINLSLGNSGIRMQTLDRLMEMYNAGAIPVIYEQGSLGASGDLAPLAHLSLPLLGRGEVRFKGRISGAEAVMKKLGMNALKLEAKEGLALLNGTQFMSAYAVYILGI